MKCFNNTGNVRINVTLRCVRVAIVAVTKQCVAYSECVFVALFIQHTKRMRRVILSSVAYLSVSFFTIIS